MASFQPPKGYFTACPYLIIADPAAELSFLKSVFDVHIKESLRDQENRIRHAEVVFGDSMVMIGRADKKEDAIPAMVHIYVADCDGTYKAALAAGAESIMEPSDQIYGDRSAGVRSQNGVSWWIGCQTEAIESDEIQRRLLQQS